MLLSQFAQYRKGYQFGEKTFYNNFHIGLDFMTPTGTPIHAHCDGYARKVVGKEIGNAVYFTEPSGRLVRMLHLSQYEKLGNVKRGDLLGYTGNTGLSTGPHIHIDVCLSGKYENRRSNFDDPEKYFEKIHIAIVKNGNTSLTSRLEAVANWYADNGIYLDWHIVESNENPVWEKGRIKREWLAKHAVPHASGQDIVAYITDNWQEEKLYGYALNEKILGVEVCCMVMRERQDGRNRGVYNNDQLAATLRHEIMHTLYDMQHSKPNNGKKHIKGADNVHYYDYTKKDLSQCFKELRRDKMRGWDDRRMFKKAGWIKTKRPFSGNPINKKIYRSTDSRMFFRYMNGWEIITEAMYNHYEKQNAKKGIMSVQEANYIYSKLGKKPPEPENYIIVDKLANSQAHKLRLKLTGWKQNIPIWNS